MEPLNKDCMPEDSKRAIIAGGEYVVFVPEQVKFVAIDLDGSVWGFTRRPEYFNGEYWGIEDAEHSQIIPLTNLQVRYYSRAADSLVEVE